MTVKCDEEQQQLDSGLEESCDVVSVNFEFFCPVVIVSLSAKPTFHNMCFQTFTAQSSWGAADSRETSQTHLPRHRHPHRKKTW